MLRKNQIPTPALLVDFDALGANLARMSERVKQSCKKLRPHTKAHKCVEIAQRQIAAGASGISVATLAEVELMSKAGINGLPLTSPVADPLMMGHIVETGAMVVVNHLQQTEWYEEAATKAGRTVDILIDLDVGDHPSGARSTKQALEIARAVYHASHLRLRGLQGDSVRGFHAGDFRRAQENLAAGISRSDRDAGCNEARRTLHGDPLGRKHRHMGYRPCARRGHRLTSRLLQLHGSRLPAHWDGHSLTVLATVISSKHEGFVTVDARLKTFSMDHGYGPEDAHLPGAGYRWGGNEFGYIDVDGRVGKPMLGHRIEFIPPHCDPTVNLYDHIYACRGDNVEAIWPVMARIHDPMI